MRIIIILVGDFIITIFIAVVVVNEVDGVGINKLFIHTLILHDNVEGAVVGIAHNNDPIPNKNDTTIY